MKKFLQFTRYYEWWDYKLGIFLATGLLVLPAAVPESIPGALGHLGLLLAAIVVGAVFVSLINDYFDLEDDWKSGKYNRQQDWPRWKSWLLIALSLAGGAFFMILFWPSRLTALAYLPPWIAFGMYSIPPVRLKERGVLGSMADASGAHLFPTLFILVGMHEHLGMSPGPALLAAFTLWSFAFGFRSIACHQFSDLEHDRQGEINTFAVLLSKPQRLQWIARAAMAAEVGSLSFALYLLGQQVLLLLLLLYLLLAAVLKRYRAIEFVAIVRPTHDNWRLLMTSFYQTVIPVVLLAQLAIVVPWMAWLLPVFFLLFLHYIKTIYYDAMSLYYLLKEAVMGRVGQ